MFCDFCNWKINTENNCEGCECDFDEEKCMEHITDEAFKQGYNKAINDLISEFEKYVKEDVKRTYYWTEFWCQIVKLSNKLKMNI